MVRQFVRATRALLALFALCALAACGLRSHAQMTDIRGVMPPLAFHMTRANDGTSVDADSYRGKAVILYFGYTHCPDECPTTLANFASAFQRLGPIADNVRLLFVSVDPARDSLPVLKSYVQAFAPEIDGLRGSDNEVSALARRYRVIYSITTATSAHAYTVMHSASVFFFDADGRARYVTMSTDNTSEITETLRALAAGR
jgi:protein SCO1/2